MPFSLSLGIIGGADGPTAIFVTGPHDGSLLLLMLLVINLVTFLIYGLDKWKARHERRRIREKTLLLLAVFGGSIGAWLGMHLFRHKTRHRYFRWGIPAILLLQLARVFGLLYLLK